MMWINADEGIPQHMQRLGDDKWAERAKRSVRSPRRVPQMIVAVHRLSVLCSAPLHTVQ